MANTHCTLWTRSFSNSHEMGNVNATPNWTLKLLRFKDSVSVPVLFFPLHKSTLNLRRKPLRAKGGWGRGPFQSELCPATWRPLLPRVRGGVQGAQPGATDSAALASGRQGPWGLQRRCAPFLLGLLRCHRFSTPCVPVGSTWPLPQPAALTAAARASALLGTGKA